MWTSNYLYLVFICMVYPYVDTQLHVLYHLCSYCSSIFNIANRVSNMHFKDYMMPRTIHVEVCYLLALSSPALIKTIVEDAAKWFCMNVVTLKPRIF